MQVVKKDSKNFKSLGKFWHYYNVYHLLNKIT